MNEATESPATREKIALWGVGNWGIATISRISPEIRRRVKNVALDSDLQSLVLSASAQRLHIGKKMTQGRGTGGDPALGGKAFAEGEGAIRKALAGTEVLLAVAGLSGGIGGGVMPPLCRLAQEMGIFTLALVARPFAFEGKRKTACHRAALAGVVSAGAFPIAFSLDRLVGRLDDNSPCQEGFAHCDRILTAAAECLISFLTAPATPGGGDCALLKNIVSVTGDSMLGLHEESDPGKLVGVMKGALSSLFLSADELASVRGCLIQIQSGAALPLGRARQALSAVTGMLAEEAMIGFSLHQEPALGERTRVSLLVCGIPGEGERAPGAFPVVKNARIHPPRQTELDFNRSTRGRFSEAEPTMVEGEDLDIPTFIRKGEKIE
jgi:cell division protein FtsZ